MSPANLKPMVAVSVGSGYPMGMTTNEIPTVIGDITRYWMNMTSVVFDPSALPDSVWFACVREATESYGSESFLAHMDTGEECTHMLGQCPYVGPAPKESNGDHAEWIAYWDKSDATHEYLRRPVDNFSPEGVAYAGHIAHDEPNKWGDTYVVAYRYNSEGHGAIVGLQEEDAPILHKHREGKPSFFGWRVSCYAN